MEERKERSVFGIGFAIGLGLGATLLSAVVLAGCGGEAIDEDAIPGEDASEDALIGNDDKGDGVTLGYRAVLRLAHEAGLPCNARAVVATAVARAESSFRTNASNNNNNGSSDYGLWQINTVHGYSRAYLFNAANNAAAMARVSNNGRNFNPWTMYRNGRYRSFLQAAWNAQAAYGCR